MHVGDLRFSDRSHWLQTGIFFSKGHARLRLELPPGIEAEPAAEGKSPEAFHFGRTNLMRRDAMRREASMLSPRFIDLYCERTAPGFWDEPVNAVSNAAFLLAAAYALPVAMGRERRDLLELLLIALGGCIGIGSFLFHTLASPAAELADVIPIWSFVTLYVLAVIWRTTGQNVVRTARIAVIAAVATCIAIWIGGQSVTTGADPAPMRLNGSLQYLPALIALTVFAGIAFARQHPACGLVAGATLVFFLSLVFRTIDLQVCAATGGVGTHFLWHLLNGLMVGLLLQALVVHMPPGRHNPEL